MTDISDEFRSAMADWVEIKRQLTDARKDMKVLNTREKQLKDYIKGYMKQQSLDLINLKKGKVSLRTATKRATFTKDAVSVERAMTCIVDNLETTETEVISLTGLEKKGST